jgi:hypothetical protein
MPFFQPADWLEQDIKFKYVVDVFGRTDKNEVAKVRLKGFRPYFYLRMRDGETSGQIQSAIEESSGKRPSFFSINHWLTTTEHDADGTIVTKAEVTVTAQGREITCCGAGNGPVNAFDKALRDGLNELYPEISALELTDYKVRILEGRLGTGAITRVLIETSDGKGEWNTVGVHENVIAASAMALEDALTFGLLRQGIKPN